MSDALNCGVTHDDSRGIIYNRNVLKISTLEREKMVEKYFNDYEQPNGLNSLNTLEPIKTFGPLYFSKKPSLKGIAQYSWPPCNNQFRSSIFCIENTIYILQNKLP